MSKLLIVDDEVDVRDFAKRFFEKRNVETLTAGGGEEALQLIAEYKPDLVLLDVRMAELSGIEVLRRLRQKDTQTKVIMVTGVENGETIKEAWDLGIVDYIHKPLVLDELEKIVLKQLQANPQ